MLNVWELRAWKEVEWRGMFEYRILKRINDNNVIESLRSRHYNLHCGLLHKRDGGWFVC